MAHRIIQRLGGLIDHYTAFCIVLALVILSLIGVGDARITGVLGFVLCIAGMTQSCVRVDLWTLISLILYDLVAMVSSLAAYGNPVDGYGAMHALFPVIYLLMGCLDKVGLHLLRRCCALWTGGVALFGIGWFAVQAVTQGRVGRLSGLLGNPNAMGIFFVVGWFVVMYCAEKDKERHWAAILPRLEPVLLIALAMTLSMGSFLAMAVGIAVLLIGKKRDASWKETGWYACDILSRTALGMGTGLLIYLAATRTNVPWVCVFVLAYGAALVVFWKTLERFLKMYSWVTLVITALGIVVTAAAVILRPSAIATFTERLEMMGSGVSYLTANPLFGVGPFRWRLLDLSDGGKYFNTWHIHNIPIHIGVEMGWIAMAAVIAAGVRVLCKKKESSLRAGSVAFLFHNLIDTSFFYLGITTLALAATGEPEAGSKRIGGVVSKIIFGLFAVLFAYSFCHAMWQV